METVWNFVNAGNGIWVWTTIHVKQFGIWEIMPNIWNNHIQIARQVIFRKKKKTNKKYFIIPKIWQILKLFFWNISLIKLHEIVRCENKILTKVLNKMNLCLSVCIWCKIVYVVISEFLRIIELCNLRPIKSNF